MCGYSMITKPMFPSCTYSAVSLISDNLKVAYARRGHLQAKHTMAALGFTGHISAGVNAKICYLVRVL